MFSSAGNSKKNHNVLFIITGLTAALFLLFIAGCYPYFVESYYTNGFYQGISLVLHLVFGWLPVSIGDLLYMLLIAALAYSIISIVKYLLLKNYSALKGGSLRLIIGLQTFAVVFYLFWGLNYSRPPAAQILNLTDSVYTLTELKAATALLIDSTNATRARLTVKDLSVTNTQVYNQAVNAIKELAFTNKNFESHYPSVKPALFTPLINYFSTAGYFNPLTGEAQVNYSMPKTNRPFTSCHELAHQIGFAREDEANFVGFLAAKQSPHALLKYSGYYMAMQEFMHNIYRRDSVGFKQLKVRLSPSVKQDLKADNRYWDKYESKLNAISGLFYDNFLKLNNQPEGIHTYNRMIILTMAYLKKEDMLNR
ncbi:DUF3810 domain-containing protein [Mucilaginibacter aquatilis]|uniref:DUF3810 family protein n=1 Tax=Mucilaginibacter aquatilis TaxID=1517760 RepID=A0A6I4IPB7_9SPHI|nr:DUF3810 domain-containing protein [Mucilaginibacter aquatilis]MVN89703.1 DUF3810 family protein [Mucilaginibacter aquatilis]